MWEWAPSVLRTKSNFTTPFLLQEGDVAVLTSFLHRSRATRSLKSRVLDRSPITMAT